MTSACCWNAANAAGGGVVSDPPVVTNANNVSASGSSFSNCGNPGSTGTPSLTYTGGVGTVTFSWVQTPGSPATNGPYTCSDTAAQNPTWSGGTVCDGDLNGEQWTCTLEDENADTDTATITVSRNWINLN